MSTQSNTETGLIIFGVVILSIFAAGLSIGIDILVNAAGYALGNAVSGGAATLGKLALDGAMQSSKLLSLGGAVTSLSLAGMLFAIPPIVSRFSNEKRHAKKSQVKIAANREKTKVAKENKVESKPRRVVAEERSSLGSQRDVRVGPDIHEEGHSSPQASRRSPVKIDLLQPSPKATSPKIDPLTPPQSSPKADSPKTSPQSPPRAVSPKVDPLTPPQSPPKANSPKAVVQQPSSPLIHAADELPIIQQKKPFSLPNNFQSLVDSNPLPLLTTALTWLMRLPLVRKFTSFGGEIGQAHRTVSLMSTLSDEIKAFETALKKAPQKALKHEQKNEISPQPTEASEQESFEDSESSSRPTNYLELRRKVSNTNSVMDLTEDLRYIPEEFAVAPQAQNENQSPNLQQTARKGYRNKSLSATEADKKKRLASSTNVLIQALDLARETPRCSKNTPSISSSDNASPISIDNVDTPPRGSCSFTILNCHDTPTTSRSAHGTPSDKKPNTLQNVDTPVKLDDIDTPPRGVRVFNILKDTDTPPVCTPVKLDDIDTPPKGVRVFNILKDTDTPPVKLDDINTPPKGALVFDILKDTTPTNAIFSLDNIDTPPSGTFVY